MSRHKKNKYLSKKKKGRFAGKTAFLPAVALVLNQTAAGVTLVSAEELQYDGTTQMATVDYSLDMDSFAAELVVEEVSVEAGDQVEEGSQILKLTEESYQAALDYYEAAILRAENTLTDTQREYEQGLLESKYKYELAETEEAQAEYVREYQQNELEDTIEKYGEIQEELADRIAEVQSGISSGSYGSSSGGSSGSSGGAGGGASGESDEMTQEEEKESGDSKKTETEVTPTPDAEVTPAPEQPETPEQPDTEKPEEESTEQQIENLKKKLQENGQLFEVVLAQMEALVGSESDTTEETENADGEYTAAQNELKTQLQSSIERDTAISGHMKNVQEMIKTVPEAVTTAASVAGIDYQKYITLLNDCMAQMDANIAAQQTVLTALEENAGSGETAGQTIDGEQVYTLLEQLRKVSQEKTELYHQLLTLEETQTAALQTQTESQQTTIADLEKQIVQLQEQVKSQQGTENTEDSKFPQEEGTAAGDTTNTTGNNTAGETPSDKASSDKDSAAEEGEGAAAGGMSAGGMSSGSMSAAAGGGGMLSGGSGAGASGGGAAAAFSDGSLTMEDMNLTETDISLFGDTYDLSQVESLLEQEPSDSDSAEKLLDQLEEAAGTVEKQYAELNRNKKATELKIQYTCDTSVLAGKLAAITYEQEQQEWEETLTEAKDKVTELEEKKAVLESMPEGVLTAEKSGTVAAVNYEAEDVLSSDTPILSYYDTETVTVTIAVPQEKIAEVQVGDSVEVTLAGVRAIEGTITEKSPEVQEGNSKTTVNYQVTVSIDNENGRLSAGMSASVTVDTSAQDTDLPVISSK